MTLMLTSCSILKIPACYCYEYLTPLAWMIVNICSQGIAIFMSKFLCKTRVFIDLGFFWGFLTGVVQ